MRRRPVSRLGERMGLLLADTVWSAHAVASRAAQTCTCIPHDVCRIHVCLQI